jgi:hypothetical protein
MRRGRAGAIALVAMLSAVTLGAASAGAAPKQARVESIVRSAAPDAQKVIESYVRIRAPLPRSAPPHPRRCDWIAYLRFRHADGPARPARADAVVVGMPGFLGGAATFDSLARNFVRAAAARGREVEFWALDRRANCLEDHTGVRAGPKPRDPRVAMGYYYGGRPVAGRRFGGFATHEEADFLKTFGLARTVRDWYRVIQRIRGRRVRARKLVCGGHSLGGPLTAAFSSWDFDGDPATKRDAGFRQCAGLFGLDTTVESDGSGPGAGGFGFASGPSPYVDVPPLSPPILQLPSVFGAAAYRDPRAETPILDLIPHEPEFDLSLRLLYSRDAAHFATGDPSIREFRLTNEAAFGGIFDDNSASLGFIRASLGIAVGGPFTDKNFPTPGDGTLALPEVPNGPLYRWQRYRRVGAGGKLPLNDSGEPYTSRESEVTDIRQFERLMFEAPANYIEQYFPTRILTDVAAARSGSFEDMRYDGPSRRPILLIQAGDSDSNTAPDRGRPKRGTPPNDFRLSRELILPGYNHLDVASAAARQNDGRPEPSSRALTAYVLQAVKAAR